MQKFQLSGFQLKVIALIGMVIDHINTHFGTMLGFPLWVSWIGRFVAPVFLYLLMEGFIYTSNRNKYFQRLYIGAILMVIINIGHNVLTGNYYHPLTNEFDFFLLINGNNIFLTLTCFYLIFSLIEAIQMRTRPLWQSCFLLIPLVLFTCLTEGGIYLLPLGIAFSISRNSKKVAVGTIAVFSVLLLVESLVTYYTSAYMYTNLYQHLIFENQFMQWIAIPLILSYSGKRGGSGKTWEKDLFYVVYPLHLAVIYFIEMAVK